MKKLWRKIVEFFTRKDDAPTIEERIANDEKKVAEICGKSKTESHRKVVEREKIIKPSVKRVRTRSKKWNRHNFVFWKTQEVTLKEAFMLNYLRERSHRWVSPTEAGRSYGVLVRGRVDYNSGHARHCMLRLVKMNLVNKNENGHYKIK